MPFLAPSWLTRGSATRRTSARLRASQLFAGGLAAMGASFAVAPAQAQYLIYEQPYVVERPPVYGPPPRGPLHYVMLPPSEVRRRLQAMGYGRISRPSLAGRLYSVVAVDEDGPVSLTVDAYSGEVLGVEPVAALPPGPAMGPAVRRPPLLPPARITAAPPRPMAPSAPLPQKRPPEADVALSAPAAAVPAPQGMGHSPAVPAAVNPAPANPVPVDAAPANATPANATPANATPANAAPAKAASAPSDAAPAAAVPAAEPAAAVTASVPAPATTPTGAGSATPGSTDAGSASVLSQPAGTN